MIPVRIGICPVCGAKIAEKGRFLPNQCQVPVVFADGSRTDVGMCLTCLGTVTDEQVQEIVDGTVEYWKERNYIPTCSVVAMVCRDQAWNQENQDGTTSLLVP